MGKPRDDKDAAQDLARDLADIAGHLASLKGEANAWLRDPNYERLKLRLECALSAVEAAAVEARRRIRLTTGNNPGPKTGRLGVLEQGPGPLLHSAHELLACFWSPLAQSSALRQPVAAHPRNSSSRDARRLLRSELAVRWRLLSS